MTYSLILFDCDGTLVDSEYLNNLAMIKVLHDFNLTQYTIKHALDTFTGLRFGEIIRSISAETGQTFPKDIAQNYLQKVRVLAPDYLKPIEGVINVVQLAHERCEHVYVVSNGERNNVLTSLDFVGLRSYFDDARVITGLMAPNPKPAPDLFLLAGEMSGVSSEHALVIEDSVAGVTAAVAAGMNAWGFTGTHHDSENHANTLRTAGASQVFSSMDDLKNALHKIQGA